MRRSSRASVTLASFSILRSRPDPVRHGKTEADLALGKKLQAPCSHVFCNVAQQNTKTEYGDISQTGAGVLTSCFPVIGSHGVFDQASLQAASCNGVCRDDCSLPHQP